MASPAQNRRNELAQARGYRNYYDYRIHDNGRIPPGQPPLAGAARARARGHAGRADFLRLIARQPDAYVLPIGQRRGPDGRYTVIHIAVLLPDKTERHFYLRGRAASQSSLRELRSEMQSAGIYWIAAPSIDVFADTNDDADDEAFAEIEEQDELQNAFDDLMDDLGATG